MPRIEWESDGRTMEIETENHFSMAAPEYVDLAMQTGRVNSRVPLASIVCARNRDEGGSPVYDYTITAKDGRVWTHRMVFDQPLDPKVTFDVPGYWRRAEIDNHWPLRRAIINIVARYKLVKLEYECA